MAGRSGARKRLEVLQVVVAGLGVPASLGIGVILHASGLHPGIGLAATAVVLMATAAALAKIDALLSRYPAPPSQRGRRTDRDRDEGGGGDGGFL
ncbi:hypothetical protein HHL19_29585 [Streptomyces sp. R302]|uniref:hypothetical protein n=1 Tax=unclassified Streptomyces TaxID=2593676 RepID=UPI00145E2040|nr:MULTISPECIES: hypothetical protein [unclassified Streptomyces]NML55278.1 hypothetical protein [Streptomyces sp. R301]NML82698.1 hypothetical protein [Streptomyces sp. R302]